MARARIKHSGQASVEYIVVATAILIALAVISTAGRQACVDNFAGDLRLADCQSIGTAMSLTLQQTVEDLTFLINMPF